MSPALGIEGAQFEDVHANGKLKFAPPSRTFLAAAATSLVFLLALIVWVLG
jgi:hypothetical protein